MKTIYIINAHKNNETGFVLSENKDTAAQLKSSITDLSDRIYLDYPDAMSQLSDLIDDNSDIRIITQHIDL